MKRMEMRGDFLSQRSMKQTEGQNPIGRKNWKGGEEEGDTTRSVMLEEKSQKKDRKEEKKDA